MFRVILMCFLTCFSSFMPLKQSVSNICEDHTQVVERKHISNIINGSNDTYYLSYSVFGSEKFMEIFLSMVDDIYNSGNPYIQYDDIGNNTGTARSIRVDYPITGVATSWSLGEFQPSSGTFIVGQPNPNTNDVDYIIINRSFAQLKLLYYEIKFYSYTDVLLETFIYSVGYGDGVTYTGYECMHVTEGNYDVIVCHQGDILWYCCQSYNSLSVPGDEYSNGFSNGRSIGFQDGIDSIINNPDNEYYQSIFNSGKQVGFQQGVDDTIASGSEAMTIFSGIMDVAFIPVNVFFLMFNYEVFGINIAGFVSGLLTIAIVIIMFKFILGRKV